MTDRLTLARSVSLVVLAGLGSVAGAAEALRADLGRTADGTVVVAVDLSSDAGVSVRLLSLGATIQSLEVPDRDGKRADIVLGYPSAAEYLEKPQYFGATVGRYANRIARGKFTLDGRDTRSETNDGPNHLHGGVHGLRQGAVEDRRRRTAARRRASYSGSSVRTVRAAIPAR